MAAALRAFRVAAPSIVRTVQARCATPALVQTRGWFGFGVPRTEKEIAQDAGVAPEPWYQKVAEDDRDEHRVVRSAEELSDREAMTKQIQQMAEADPQVVPDAGFYKQLFDMLIKWDDRHGVKVTQTLASENGVQLDAATEKRVEDYIIDADTRSFHEGGAW
eukprot:m.477913 g.477913  ORF g.477913 m.477913 type:complete len:162 (+) comp20985_c0_seq1:236-721(+)